jgi:hypothetical protein
MKKSILIIIVSILIQACGEATTINNNNIINIIENNNSTKENNSPREENNSSTEDNLTIQNSLKGIELYYANLKQINGNRRYDIEKFDGITSNLVPLYFDFNIKNFIQRDASIEVFQDGQRNSFLNIDYQINNTGQLVASLNQKNIYTLDLISKASIKTSKFEEYRSNIDIEGIVYNIKTSYLSNFYVIEKLFSSEVFESLTAFTEKYKKKSFLGDYFRGLVFAENNKLQEFKDGNYTEAGTYEIKIVNQLEVLTIYPNDSNYYYADKSCYVLSFSRVWKAKCFEKGLQETTLYYDKDVYDDLTFYLREKFISINISI